MFALGTRLDPLEIFSDPVDDSFAPNYSRVIRTPMCFNTMRAKIHGQKYATWRNFVVRPRLGLDMGGGISCFNDFFASHYGSGLAVVWLV